MAMVIDEGSWGKSLGTGLSQGLQTLANMKLKQYMQKQQEDKFSMGLEALGYPREKAQALAPLLSSGFGGTTARTNTGFGAQKNILSRLIDYRRSLGGGNANKAVAMSKKLKTGGISDNILNGVKDNKLTDDMVDFLLQQTGNDPKKAKLIAQKMGFKV
jgi:hypothetical protein